MTVFQPLIYRWDPAWAIEQCKMFPMSGTISSTSSYTGSSKASVLPNSPWQVQFKLAVQNELQWAPVESFLARLDGPSNWARLFHPLKTYPRGKAAGIWRGNVYTGIGPQRFSDGTAFSDGTTFIDGSTRAYLARTHYRGEKNVLITGLVPNTSVSLMVGDHMEIGGYLHMAVANCSADANGRALVPIRPALRIDIPVNDALNYVEFSYATSPFMLGGQSGDFDGMEVTPPDIAEIGVSFIEALP